MIIRIRVFLEHQKRIFSREIAVKITRQIDLVLHNVVFECCNLTDIL